MNDEDDQTFQTILQELKTITVELQLVSKLLARLSVIGIQELRAVTAELQCLRDELKPSAPAHRTEETDLTRSNAPTANPPRQPETEETDLTESKAPTANPPRQPEKESAIAVYDWLTAKGVTVNNYREPGAADAVYDQLAVFLGERFENLSRVHDLIRRHLSTGSGFTLNLYSQSQDEIAETTQFCTTLSSYAFLSSYKYNRSTKTIYATPQRVGKVINFFTGGWFERYVYLKVLPLLSQNELDFTCLLNPQITFSNGDDFELDLLFLIDNQPLWIECKTGDYQTYITKYSDARKLLSVPKQRAILVILGISDTLATNLTHLYDMTVANENNFLGKIGAALGLSEFPQDDEGFNLSVSVGLPSTLSTLLNKASLRPLPEHRQQVIRELITIAGELNQPTTMNEVKSLIAERMPLSKSKLRDILNAAMRGRCFLDDNGLAISSSADPFSKLVSDSPSVIESKCIESYVRAVLRVDPGYFEDAQNVREFEHTVGNKAPDIAIIRGLGEQASDQALTS